MDRLLSRRVFGGQSGFRLLLEFGPSAPPLASAAERERQWDTLVRLPRALATVELQWDDSETESAVVDRFTQRVGAVQASNGEERVVLSLHVTPGSARGAGDRVRVQLQYTLAHPALRCISVSAGGGGLRRRAGEVAPLSLPHPQNALVMALGESQAQHLPHSAPPPAARAACVPPQLARVTSSGAASEPLLRALLQQCQLEGLWKLKSSEGFGNFWATCVDPARLGSLRNMNLSYCALASLPGSIGLLSTLRILRLSHNKLSTLPAELGQLTALEVLAADANQLLSVPGEATGTSAARRQRGGPVHYAGVVSSSFVGRRAGGRALIPRERRERGGEL